MSRRGAFCARHGGYGTVRSRRNCRAGGSRARSRRSCSHRCEGKCVCFPDLLITYGKYQIRPEPPFIPGAEISGVVVSAPEGSGFAPGDRVLAAAYLGGYAERIAVNPAQVLRIPDGLAFDEAASLIINYQTMEFALARRAKIVAGETVVVLGAAGGVGTATIQLAKAHGARVIAVVRREGVDDFLRELGADEVVALAPGWGERIRELTDASALRSWWIRWAGMRSTTRSGFWHPKDDSW